MLKYTFQNGDVLEMKAVQHSAFASQETHCYHAKLYFNGKPFCEVRNEGYGGADHQDGIGKVTYSDIRALDQRCRDEMPKWSMIDDEQMDTDLEIWCGEQINKHLADKELSRLMRTKVVLVEDNSISVVGFKNTKKIDDRHIAHVSKQYPNLAILNTMPKAEALEIFERLSS